jgi:hypothetical protein
MSVSFCLHILSISARSGDAAQEINIANIGIVQNCFHISLCAA